MATYRYPAAIMQNYYGAVVPHVIGVLLGSATTSIPGTVKTINDLTSYEISTGGGYTQTGGVWSTTVGVQFPDFVTQYDDTTGISEVGPTGPLLSSTNFLTVSFRWLALASNNEILTIVDFGSSQSIADQPLVLSLPVSTYIAGSYPMIRVRRAITAPPI